MGTYVTNPIADTVDISPLPDEPFVGVFVSGGFGDIDHADALVISRFAESKAYADEFLSRLTSQGGYLDALNAAIVAFDGAAIVAPSVTIPDLSITIPAAPTMSGTVSTDFLSQVTTALAWTESGYDSSLYTALLARIIADLTTGASGIGGTVEQEIYDRYLARTATDNDRQYREAEDYHASRNFDLPTGALNGTMLEVSASIAAKNLEASGKIMIEQAELAQKNSQFVIGAARELETVLRDFHDKTNNRSLDTAKALAENIIAAVTAANKAITEVYTADVQGYESTTRALTENQKGNVSAYGLQIQNADLELRAAIAVAEAAVQGYSAEYGLKEKVATAMANISMQASSAAFGAVNASAGVSFSGGASVSESWNHGESRSLGYSKGESRAVSQTNSYGHDESIRESHEFTEG